jgi:hypothetical protein
MKKKITSLFTTLALVVSSFVFAAIPLQAGAINVFQSCGSGAATTGGAPQGGTGTGSSSGDICGAKGEKFEDLMKKVINTVLFVLGMIAVIMIVVGGIRYTTSNGDSAQIQSAKNTIMYAVVGLVIAILAFPIVGFVIDKIGGK